MASTWELRLRNQSGAYVAALDRWLEWTVTHKVNAPTAYGLHLDGTDSRCALFAYDAQLEFWRVDADNGIAWYREAEAFHVNPHWYRDGSGRLNFASTGKGYVDLLARTIVTAKAGTAGANKTGQGETVIKAFVNEQAGPGAGARARSGLTMQADAAGGNAISLQRSHRNLLEVCQDVAAIGGGDFDIVGTHAAPNGPATFQFRFYAGQRGTDRTATVIFSEALGNMGEASLDVKRAQVLNYAVVGGQGEGAAREEEIRSDPGDIALSPWGQREVFVDAREVTAGNAAALQDKGDAALAENRQTIDLTFRVLQTPGSLYGKAYFLGDLVTAKYNGVSYTRKIQTVTITNNRSGMSIDVGTVSYA